MKHNQDKQKYITISYFYSNSLFGTKSREAIKKIEN